MLFCTHCRCVALHVTHRKACFSTHVVVVLPCIYYTQEGMHFYTRYCCLAYITHRKACFSTHVVVLPCMSHIGRHAFLRTLLCCLAYTQEGMLFYTRRYITLHIAHTGRRAFLHTLLCCLACYSQEVCGFPVRAKKLRGTFFALHVAHRKACFSTHAVVLPCMLLTGSVWLVLLGLKN